jgi:hypothetical protein
MREIRNPDGTATDEQAMRWEFMLYTASTWVLPVLIDITLRKPAEETTGSRQAQPTQAASAP